MKTLSQSENELNIYRKGNTIQLAWFNTNQQPKVTMSYGSIGVIKIGVIKKYFP